jgi:hypothetical protein
MKTPCCRTTRTPHFVLSLRRYFFTSLLLPLQKRRRPSRSDGGCCEKGVPSSGEKIVVPRAQLFGGGAACLNMILPCPPGTPCVTA